MIGGIESNPIAACLALLILLHAIAQAGNGCIVLLREHLAVIACQQRRTLKGCQALSCQRPCSIWPCRCSAMYSSMRIESAQSNDADKLVQPPDTMLVLQEMTGCPGLWSVS